MAAVYNINASNFFYGIPNIIFGCGYGPLKQRKYIKSIQQGGNKDKKYLQKYINRNKKYSRKNKKNRKITKKVVKNYMKKKITQNKKKNYIKKTFRRY